SERLVEVDSAFLIEVHTTSLADIGERGAAPVMICGQLGILTLSPRVCERTSAGLTAVDLLHRCRPLLRDERSTTVQEVYNGAVSSRRQAAGARRTGANVRRRGTRCGAPGRPRARRRRR